MNRIAVSFALMFALVAAAAQAQPAQGTSGPAEAACPPSTTLEELTKALDDAISGPRDKDRACLRNLLLPGARLTPIRKQAEGFAPRILTLDDWINAVRGQGGAPFYEKQVKVKSETYGHFAHLWSTYEIRSTPDSKPDVIGVNSVQAVFDGLRWRVLSILWESNATAGPVPEKYLP
jgi:hypothetical protein